MEPEKQHKPLWKQLALTGIPFGAGMALLWWLFGSLVGMPTDFVFMLSFGLLSAILFGAILTFYERWRWGQLEATEVPFFRSSEKILLTTPAFHDNHNGWLTLSKHGLLFKVRSSNYRDRLIRFAEIVAVKEWREPGSSGNGIEVDLVSGEAATFEIEDIEPWRNLFAVTWTSNAGEAKSRQYYRNPLSEAHVL